MGTKRRFAVLPGAGEKGQRFAMPLSRIALESPTRGACGQADDIQNELVFRSWMYVLENCLCDIGIISWLNVINFGFLLVNTHMCRPPRIKADALRKEAGTIICAPRGYLAPYYLWYVRDVSALKKKQWAAHAIYCLVEGIDKYKKAKGSTRHSLRRCNDTSKLYNGSELLDEHLDEPALDEFSAQSISNMAWALPKIGGESRYRPEMVKVDAQLGCKIG
ncbi:ATP-dependent Clp protease proteolytic subunit-related protein 2 [Tanacetum coccineum]